MITHEQIKRMFDYDSETGLFRWKETKSNKVRGKIAGSIRADGRRHIGIGNERFLSSRLAWFYIYGVWPIYQIDHKDLNYTNDAITNLRDVPSAINNANRSLITTNSSGLRGVSFYAPLAKWRARYSTKHLGYFATKEEAAECFKRFMTKNYPIESHSA